MTVSDIMIVLATIIGPVAAVQVQKLVERARERRGKKLWIFQTLMATRAVRAVSNEHVQALNLIELFFDGKSKKEKAVRDAWASYLDFFNNKVGTGQTEEFYDAHNQRGINHLVALLKTLSTTLGYDFNEVQLKRGAYNPQGHEDDRVNQVAIQKGLAALLSGRQTVKMDVVSLPISPEALNQQLKIQDAILKLVSGEQALRIISK